MSLIFNQFTILSPLKKKAFNCQFTDKLNLIIGIKDSGKSTIARAIFYTLGCDVKDFDFIEKFPDNIYILDLTLSGRKYTVIRKKLKDGSGKNFYKVVIENDKSNVFYNTKIFKDFLNDILNINIVVKDKTYSDTKLYPNHIFLPFYTDQDNSWQKYLSSTFNGINFIENHKTILLEYFTGMRPNEYYSLHLQKQDLVNQIDEIKALIKSKNIIIQENIEHIKIVENVDIDAFKEQYNYFIKVYNNILNSEHLLKTETNNSIYKKNSYQQALNTLNNSITTYIDSEINEKCPNCHQIVYKDMEDNYKYYLIKENLIKEREKIQMELQKIEEELSGNISRINSLKEEHLSIKNKLDALPDLVDLQDRADSYALSQVNERLVAEIVKLETERGKREGELDEVEKSLRNLNKIDIAKPYRQLMIEAFSELDVPFEYKTYFTSNLESVKIELSGATKVQAFIAQYIVIYELITMNEKVTKIPMVIDTFLKDDLNDEELRKTAKFISKHLENKHQAFLFISNNSQTLDAIAEYKFSKIELNEKSNILNQDYDKFFNQYSKYILD